MEQTNKVTRHHPAANEEPADLSQELSKQAARMNDVVDGLIAAVEGSDKTADSANHTDDWFHSIAQSPATFTENQSPAK